ncbi:hypothetical protein N185_05850 [Sinorhizobium sp. GW3]|nr:hypothetical protein N185_05850 [Sinorhizobium sp. GW3]
MGLVGLQDDEAGISFRPLRRHQKVDRSDRAGARLQAQEPAQAVIDRVDRLSCSAIELPGIFGTPPIATLPISPSQ